MRINELRGGDEPTFSFEFFPPKTPEGEANLYRALAELRPLDPAYVSVTYGAGGTTRSKTLEIVSRIKAEFGLEAMAHFTCVGATTAELRGTPDEMRTAGLDNGVALRGEPPGGAPAPAQAPAARRGRVGQDRGRPGVLARARRPAAPGLRLHHRR